MKTNIYSSHFLTLACQMLYKNLHKPLYSIAKFIFIIQNLTFKKSSSKLLCVDSKLANNFIEATNI